MARVPKSTVGKKIRSRALGYPETTEHFPWGEHAFKVKGKSFVFVREDHGMGAKGWVTLRPASKTSLELLYSLIDESVRNVAPRRVLQASEAKPSN